MFHGKRALLGRLLVLTVLVGTLGFLNTSEATADFTCDDWCVPCCYDNYNWCVEHLAETGWTENDCFWERNNCEVGCWYYCYSSCR